MSELIHQFSEEIVDTEGRSHTVRIRGSAESNGQWQGWLEFLPREGGPALQTPRETTQSRREHLDYWATGLSRTYLEQALRRARPTDSESPAPPPALEPIVKEPRSGEGGAEKGVSPGPGVHTLEIDSLDPSLPGHLMGLSSVAPGTLRRVPGAGVIVLDEVQAPEGRTTTFRFSVQIGSENAGAVNMGNRLWSALRDEGATLRIDGRPVDIASHSIIEALRT